ncbi:MAG TPA: amino acid ABC transporter substrate-binding protein [Steroidobacteraceae bacterium]|nr:amino acid ABC transporter substrate-binding protein [Steroidobacteraceae bacterium]
MNVERTTSSHRHRVRSASRAIAAFAVASIGLAAATSVSAATLDRIKESGHIKFGYLDSAPPLSYKNKDGTAEGYGITLCEHIADAVKTQLGLSQLTVDWVPVTLEDRLQQVKQGNIDLLCTPTIETLSRRQEVSFSVSVFAGGNRAVVRADAAAALRNALAEHPDAKPVWRGSPAAKLLENTTFAVVSGTTTEAWLKERAATFQVNAKVTPVADYRSGLHELADGKVSVFFGDRALILGAMDDATRPKLAILNRLFTHEQSALALARGDEDFRLAVDSALSQLYASDGFADLVKKWAGSYDDRASAYFQWMTLGQ